MTSMQGDLSCLRHNICGSNALAGACQCPDATWDWARHGAFFGELHADDRVHGRL